MANVTVKAKSGNIKRDHDRRRAASCKARHTRQITHGYHSKPMDRYDDPLGAKNMNVLLAMQNR